MNQLSHRRKRVSSREELLPRTTQPAESPLASHAQTFLPMRSHTDLLQGRIGSRLQALQRTAGNKAVLKLLAHVRGTKFPSVQRMKIYNHKTGEEKVIPDGSAIPEGWSGQAPYKPPSLFSLYKGMFPGASHTTFANVSEDVVQPVPTVPRNPLNIFSRVDMSTFKGPGSASVTEQKRPLAPQKYDEKKENLKEEEEEEESLSEEEEEEESLSEEEEEALNEEEQKISEWLKEQGCERYDLRAVKAVQYAMQVTSRGLGELKATSSGGETVTIIPPGGKFVVQYFRSGFEAIKGVHEAMKTVPPEDKSHVADIIGLKEDLNVAVVEQIIPLNTLFELSPTKVDAARDSYLRAQSPKISADIKQAIKMLADRGVSQGDVSLDNVGKKGEGFALFDYDKAVPVGHQPEEKAAKDYGDLLKSMKLRGVDVTNL